MPIAGIVGDIGVIVTAVLAFIACLLVWKREFVGKRKIELAESVLAQFYRAADAIRATRSPLGYEGEGKSRERHETETEEKARIKDRAYTPIERYKAYSEVFADLQSVKYRTMAVFGREAAHPFEEINAILNEILGAAMDLGESYWPNQGRVVWPSEEQRQQHWKEMHELEALVYRGRAKNDTVDARMENVLQEVRQLARSAVRLPDNEG